MTDETVNTVPAPDAVQPSQIIEPRDTDVSAQGRGVHIPEAEAAKEAPKLSTRDAIAKAFDDTQKVVEEKAKGAVEQAKVKVDETEKTVVKAEKPRADDGKFAKTEAVAEVKAEKGAPEAATAERSAPEDKGQSEGRKFAEPPARFLPEAREKWMNVPGPIRSEVHRISEEMEAETAKYKSSHERYETFKGYDEEARKNGQDLRATLDRLNNIGLELQRNPIRGLEQVLQQSGPRKPDGSPFSLMEIAQHIVQNPQNYQQAMQQQMPQAQQPQAPQKNPEVEELRAEIQMMKAEQTIVPVITNFASTHPDYHALEDQIVKILGSGVIDQIYGSGLSAEQKLAEAYRMAGGRAPSSRSEAPVQTPAHSAPVIARPVDPDGQKSIKGAPTAGQSGDPQRRFKTNREALEAAFAEAR